MVTAFGPRIPKGWCWKVWGYLACLRVEVACVRPLRGSLCSVIRPVNKFIGAGTPSSPKDESTIRQNSPKSNESSPKSWATGFPGIEQLQVVDQVVAKSHEPPSGPIRASKRSPKRDLTSSRNLA